MRLIRGSDLLGAIKGYAALAVLAREGDRYYAALDELVIAEKRFNLVERQRWADDGGRA